MEKLGALARVAKRAADQMGKPEALALAVIAVVIWAASGPFFRYNESWYLILNTITTLVTFLMVFLVQTARHRDTQAIQLKLDEMIRATEGARNHLMALEGQHEDNVVMVRQGLEHEAAKASTAASRTG